MRSAHTQGEVIIENVYTRQEGVQILGASLEFCLPQTLMKRTSKGCMHFRVEEK